MIANKGILTELGLNSLTDYKPSPPKMKEMLAGRVARVRWLQTARSPATFQVFGVGDP